MNILELCLTGGLGGLEVYVFRISEALSKNHTVSAATSGKLFKHFRKHSDIKTVQTDCLFRPLPLLTAYKLARYIDKNQIDIIHAHWTKDLPLAALAKIMSRAKPKLIFTRQMDITRSKDDFYHRMQYSQVNLFLTITEKLAESCRRFIGKSFKGRIETLYHGVPVPEHFLTSEEFYEQRSILGFDSNDFVIGLFGRLEKSKGQHLLIEAIAQAKKEKIELKALIVGHEMVAGYRQTLKTLAEKLDVADQIIFNDFVNNPQSLMQLCDCIALTTYNETFGLVLPEAMRCGVCVIGSNRGGVTEIINDGYTGLLFKSENSSSLCKQLIRLYKEPELRNTLAKNGKEKADTKFNDTTHIKNLEKLLETNLS